MKKGYFPHLANTLANQKYVGPYFPVDMYNPGEMSVKDREVFLAWHKGKIENGAIWTSEGRWKNTVVVMLIF